MKFTEAEIYLMDNDSQLSRHISLHGTIPLQHERGYFEALAGSIISQQISVKAAAKIFERFRKATKLDPEVAARLNETQIKEIGLSSQKSKYLQDLALHFIEDSSIFDHLHKLPDDHVIEELTQVKGIGVWTAQMFLMFTLHRPDVFASGDRGLQLAIEKIYNISPPINPARLEEFAQRWEPYRTTASLHLWRTLDNQPQ